MLGRDPCRECRRAVRDGLKEAQDCDTCKIARLVPANNDAWFLITQAAPVLFNGTGGADFAAIHGIMDLYEIPAWRRRELFDKFLVYIQEVREVWKMKKGNG